MAMKGPGALLAFFAAVFRPATSATFCELPWKFFPGSTLIVGALSNTTASIGSEQQRKKDLAKGTGPQGRVIDVSKPRRIVESPSGHDVLPAGKVFPIQIGSELFRLSGASISSDGKCITRSGVVGTALTMLEHPHTSPIFSQINSTIMRVVPAT